MRAVVYAIILCLSILPVAGCGMTAQQRLDLVQSYIDAGQAASVSLDQAIAAAELVVDETQAALSDPNLPAQEVEKILAVQVEARKHIATFKSKKALIDGDIGRWEELLVKAKTEGADAISEIEVYGGGLQILGTRIGGQAGGYVALAGALMAGVGGAVAGLARNMRTRKTLEGVVGSVSALLASDAVTDPEQAKGVLRAAQLPGVRSEVRTILGKQ
jgi:hypothetical protein